MLSYALGDHLLCRLHCVIDRDHSTREKSKKSCRMLSVLWNVVGEGPSGKGPDQFVPGYSDHRKSANVYAIRRIKPFFADFGGGGDNLIIRTVAKVWTVEDRFQIVSRRIAEAMWQAGTEIWTN